VIAVALNYGWRPAFFIAGVLGVVMGAVWYWLYRDPQNHPGLSESERKYIEEGQTPVAAKPNVLAVVSQPKFLGIIIARFLTEPAWQSFQYFIPLYMVGVRGMDIKQFALFGWLTFAGSDLGCVVGGYLAPFLQGRFKLHIVNARLAVITIGACCMIGPALISFAVDPITAILCFALGGFAHQMLSSMMYALMGDVFEKSDVATATGIAGMFGYLGGTLFTLLIGALADTIGYNPLFALLLLFDLVAAATLWAFIGVRKGAAAAPA
jgi:ACS family hexuronate transporter-like MFS transporter